MVMDLDSTKILFFITKKEKAHMSLLYDRGREQNSRKLWRLDRQRDGLKHFARSDKYAGGHAIRDGET